MRRVLFAVYYTVCRNGADTYLLYGGVVNLVAILVGQVSNFCTKKAMADGIIDQTEKRNLTIMKVVGGLVALVQVVILFWVKIRISKDYHYSHYSCNSS